MSEETYRKIFSKNLNYYMNINQKMQTDLVNDLGFNKSAVSTWCDGTRLPRMDKVDALAKYFGIKRSDLIEDKKEATATNYIQVDNTERIIIQEYRKADDITKAMVLRALSIEDSLQDKKGVERRA